MIEVGGIICVIIVVGRILFNLIDNWGPPLPKIKEHKDYR